MMRRFLPLLLLATLLATGCRSLRPEVQPAPPEPPQPRQYTLINLEGEVEGYTFRGQVRLAHDSLLWASATKVIELGRLLATPDSLWLHAPLLGADRSGNYADLQRLAGQRITFAQLQAILLADDAERRIADLTTRLGYHATVRITRRETVPSLTFPFKKP